MWFYCLIAIVCSSAVAAPLTVIVANVTSTCGTVRVAVYADASTYLDEARAVCKQETPATNGTVTLSFTNAPATSCALAVFHDINGNKTLDKNMVGSPVEPYGFSRNARGTFGPPKFAKTVVALTATNRVINVRIE